MRIRGRGWCAVRNLHARDDHGRAATRQEAVLGYNPRGACGQSLPVHWLRGHLPSHTERMRTAVSPLQLSQPGSLGEALRMLRDEDHAIPLAGCTDLYVSLNFGTLEGTRFVNIW